MSIVDEAHPPHVRHSLDMAQAAAAAMTGGEHAAWRVDGSDPVSKERADRAASAAQAVFDLTRLMQEHGSGVRSLLESAMVDVALDLRRVALEAASAGDLSRGAAGFGSFEKAAPQLPKADVRMPEIPTYDQLAASAGVARAVLEAGSKERPVDGAAGTVELLLARAKEASPALKAAYEISAVHSAAALSRELRRLEERGGVLTPGEAEVSKRFREAALLGLPSPRTISKGPMSTGDPGLASLLRGIDRGR